MTSLRAIVLAVAAALLACIVGVLAGSSGFGLASPDIMTSIRVPRVLAGFGAGAALAVSGALMQLLTRNALADPYVLGVAGGAAVGALGAMLVAARDRHAALGVGRRRRRGHRRRRRRRRLLFGLLWRRLASTATSSGGDGVGGAAAGRRDDRLGLLGARLADPHARRRGPAARHGVLAARRPQRRDPLGDRLDRARARARRRLADARASSTGWRAAMPGRRRSACRSAGAAAPCCWRRRSRPAPRSRRPARSASSASSCRMRCAGSAFAPRRCCCRRARSPAAPSSSPSTRSRARSSRRCSCRSACSPPRSACRPSSPCCWRGRRAAR